MEEVIRLLEEDPDLAEGLDSAEREDALPCLLARAVTVDPGPWQLEGLVTSRPGDLGLLVLGGIVVRTAEVTGRHWVDLLDRGNVLRPWDPLDDRAGLLPIASSWTVLAELRLAVLDRHFAGVACRWPALVEALLTRSLRHSRWLAAVLAINSRPRVDDRLLALFRHLAGRWGRVTPDGVVVNLPLTHDTLAHIVGAQRSSVTTALAALAECGELRRVPGQGWVLGERDP